MTQVMAAASFLWATTKIIQESLSGFPRTMTLDKVQGIVEKMPPVPAELGVEDML